ncbi:hypothetical protein DSECCO2_215760 [anaerobic digester metagenome]
MIIPITMSVFALDCSLSKSSSMLKFFLFTFLRFRSAKVTPAASTTKKTEGETTLSDCFPFVGAEAVA